MVVPAGLDKKMMRRSPHKVSKDKIRLGDGVQIYDAAKNKQRLTPPTIQRDEHPHTEPDSIYCEEDKKNERAPLCARNHTPIARRHRVLRGLVQEARLLRGEAEVRRGWAGTSTPVQCPNMDP